MHRKIKFDNTQRIKVKETRPNIQGVTHQMSCKKRKDPFGSTVHYDMMNYKVIVVSTWWYWVIISWYCLVLSGKGSV